MAVAERDDPYLTFRFVVRVDDKDFAGFSEASGLGFETMVETFREGGLNYFEHELAGPTRYPSRLTLKRGLTDDGALWEWHQDIIAGRITRKNVTIVLQDSAGEEQWSWKFRDACPVKWSGPEFRAGTSEIAFESVELVHNGLEPE